MLGNDIILGGTLTSSPKKVFELITNPDMLECNQNGVTGKLVKRISTYSEKVDVWKTNHKTRVDEGWICVFNRNSYMELIRLKKEELGLSQGKSYHLYVCPS